MSYNLVNPTTGDLTQVAGGTLYADLPIGSWVKNDMATIPSGFLKEEDTISQSECPELYAKYGSTVPYKADTSELGDYENITFPTTAQYDGVIITTAYDGGYLTFRINDNLVYIRTQSSGINAGTATVPIHKGDVIGFDGAAGNYNIKVRYYKKSLIVKAKQVALPVDFISAVDDIIKDTTVDAVTNGDMSPITSNAVYDEFKKIQPQVYECSGFLINSTAGEITGYGRATIILRDGIAEIKFSARIHTNTMTSTFSWGLNRDLLRTLLPDLPNITPVSTNSNLQFFAATGAVLVDLMGYGAMASGENQFWIPARMYQTDGSTGVWGSDQFPVNSYITGTVYGAYAV